MGNITAVLDLPEKAWGSILRPILLLGGVIAATWVFWQGWATLGNPNPLAPDTRTSAAVLDIAVLVFREGLECVLVLAAITAGMDRGRVSSRKPIIAGVGAGFAATLATWLAAVHLMDDLSRSVSALALQAATGLVAIAVLLVVMNWFFHKVYWTGWISLHNERKRELVERAESLQTSRLRIFLGMALLGLTSFYREGFEVVLFLQSYRLRLGNATVLRGAIAGCILAGAVAVFTFVTHRKLPYRRMLVLSGILLGVVLVVMVGEQAQEMQLAHWISTTKIASLSHAIPPWMGLWLSVFPTVETLAAQAAAAGLVLGSYIVVSSGMVDSHEPTTVARR